MTEEPGPQIIWDVVTKRVIIIFCGSVIDLPGPFPDQVTAIAAAEARCREMGRVNATPASLTRVAKLVEKGG